MSFEYIRATENEAVQSAATVTSTNFATGYPIANVVNLPVSLPYRSGATSRRILIDLGSAKSCDTMVLVGSNLSSSHASTLRGGNSPNPTGPVNVAIQRGERGVSYAFFPASSRRYWGLRFTDTGTTFTQVGFLILGSAASIQPVAWGEQAKRVKRFRRVENEFGLDLTGAKTYDGTEFSCNWPGLSLSESNAIEQFLDSLNLTTNPALILPDGRNTTDPLYGRLQQNQERTKETGGYYSIGNVQFITDDLGRTIS